MRGRGAPACGVPSIGPPAVAQTGHRRSRLPDCVRKACLSGHHRIPTQVTLLCLSFLVYLSASRAQQLAVARSKSLSNSDKKAYVVRIAEPLNKMKGTQAHVVDFPLRLKNP